MTADMDTILPARALNQRSWLRRLGRSNALTISVSLLLHGALFFACYYVAFHEQTTPRRVVIPEARLAPMGSGGPMSPGEAPRLNLQSLPPPTGAANTDGPGLPVTGSALMLSDVPVVAVNLAGGGRPIVGDVEGTEHGPSTIAGAGNAGGGLMGTGYGGGGGGAGSGFGGPACSFFGAVGNAYKVVYVVDISGSLAIYLDDIIRNVNESVRGLTPAQRFQILTYMSDPDGTRIVEFAAGRLTYANEKNKAAAGDFTKNLKVVRGAFDPVRALTMAYALQPELIYLLSDGEYDEFPELVTKVRELHQQCPTKITAISFNPAPRNMRLLQSVVNETGGNFRLVEESRLGK